MELYEFECLLCGHVWTEVDYPINEECPECGGEGVEEENDGQF